MKIEHSWINYFYNVIVTVPHRPHRRGMYIAAGPHNANDKATLSWLALEAQWPMDYIVAALPGYRHHVSISHIFARRIIT